MLTDSGGIQEEAPTLGTPVLCCATPRSARKASKPASRDSPGRLPGHRPRRHRAAPRSPALAAMARAVNPYGDGLAAERIAAILGGEPWSPFEAAAVPEIAAATT